MRTEANKTSPETALTPPRRPDPHDLWMDLSVPPETLVRIDPLDITTEMVERAEQPELDDYVLMRLPPRRFSLRAEADFRNKWRKRRREEGSA